MTILKVVWHTGKALACSAVGPQFNSQQGHGILKGPILFSIRMAHYSVGKTGWFSSSNTFLSPVRPASGCMWIWFANSIPALVGFLWVLRFPLTPKNQNPSIFLVHSLWYHVVCTSLLDCMCAAAVTQRRLEDPVGCKSQVYKKRKLLIILVRSWVVWWDMFALQSPNLMICPPLYLKLIYLENQWKTITLRQVNVYIFGKLKI